MIHSIVTIPLKDLLEMIFRDYIDLSTIYVYFIIFLLVQTHMMFNYNTFKVLL